MHSSLYSHQNHELAKQETERAELRVGAFSLGFNLYAMTIKGSVMMRDINVVN